MFIGAKDAKKFYISSALSSGRVPELAGMLMMALEEGAPIQEILHLICPFIWKSTRTCWYAHDGSGGGCTHPRDSTSHLPFHLEEYQNLLVCS